MQSRKRSLPAYVLLTALLPLATAQAQQDATPLVTGKALTPQGKQTNVGSFPANMLLTPNRRFLVVSNTGFRQFVSVLSAEDGRLLSQLGFNGLRKDESLKREGLYYGLAFGPERDGQTTLYVSRGAEDRVSILAIDTDGKLTDTGKVLDNPSSVPKSMSPHHIAGLALNRDGSRLYAVNNNTSAFTEQKGSLSILDTAANKVVAKVPLPGFPYAVAALTAGPNAEKKVYVTSERDGVVSVVNPETATVSKNVRTGMHPMALLLDRAQTRLFVANAGSDTVSILNTQSDKVERTILLRPNDLRGLPGATPTNLALSPDESRLYVTLADMNAVAIVDLKANALAGYIPVGWYPTAVVVSPDGQRLFVANAKGVATRNPNGKPVGENGVLGQYIENIIEGTVSTLDTPSADELSRLTAQVIANNRVRPDLEREVRAGFRNPGIKHVIYIIKENRTYDQVLGDMPQGNGDPSLVLFGKEVTPNLHALAERFVLLDNFYCCAEVSADGWQWSVAGMTSEYTSRNAPYNYSGRGRSYDFEGQNNSVPVDLLGIPDVARPPSGYLWELCAKKGLSFRNYGFYVSSADADSIGPDGKPLAEDNTPNKKALVGKTDVNFRYFDMAYADSDAWMLHNAPAPKQTKAYGQFNAPSRFAEWKREFDAYLKNGDLPRFMMVRFPRDHTQGTAPDMSSPRAMVADNDYAVGQLVEAVSHSPYWKETAICIVEDDAQNGYDHVDAHRSIAFVISPYIKKGTVDSRFYNTDSMLRTMELLLGLPPMSQYDAIAAPIAVFGPTADNAEPYTAILPAREIISEVNRATAYRAQDSARLIHPLLADATPDDELNDILWHAIKGIHTPKPPKRFGLRLTARDDD
ncbi:MAG TPA: alkaline phosphatase family protein [Chthonomonadaceae bacterium]|nr:alkaline phosphatase family protein [Chthonomonadaceae bacterium]